MAPFFPVEKTIATTKLWLMSWFEGSAAPQASVRGHEGEHQVARALEAAARFIEIALIDLRGEGVDDARGQEREDERGDGELRQGEALRTPHGRMPPAISRL